KYRILKSESADEAMKLSQEHKENLSLIVADILLRSDVSGTQVGLRVRESCPDMPILFTSGTPLEGWSDADFANLKTLMLGRVDFLQKPFTVETLVSKVENLLNRDSSTPE